MRYKVIETFLGFANYHRDFKARFSIIVAPLITACFSTVITKIIEIQWSLFYDNLAESTWVIGRETQLVFLHNVKISLSLKLYCHLQVDFTYPTP